MNNKENLKTAFRTLAGKNRLAKHYIKKKLAQDAGEHRVTVNAGSKEGGGSHVLLDGEGRVIAGLGGKFKGQNIDRIERKKFINQNAWGRQRKALTEKAKARQAKIDAGRPGHSVTVGTVTDNVRDAINQKGDLQSAYATLKDQIAGLKEGTGIENKNGRFEVSFNAFPSYKLRTDMKNNGFKWDPNTKVWHTTDREKLDQVLSRHFTERT